MSRKMCPERSGFCSWSDSYCIEKCLDVAWSVSNNVLFEKSSGFWILLKSQVSGKTEKYYSDNKLSIQFITIALPSQLNSNFSSRGTNQLNILHPKVTNKKIKSNIHTQYTKEICQSQQEVFKPTKPIL